MKTSPLLLAIGLSVFSTARADLLSHSVRVIQQYCYAESRLPLTGSYDRCIAAARFNTRFYFDMLGVAATHSTNQRVIAGIFENLDHRLSWREFSDPEFNRLLTLARTSAGAGRPAELTRYATQARALLSRIHQELLK
jgi:hypothetical protein